MTDEIKSIAELNKIGEAKLAEEQTKKVVSIGDLVENGAVKETAREHSVAEKEINSVFDGTKILAAAEKRAAVWQEKIDETMERRMMNEEETENQQEFLGSESVVAAEEDEYDPADMEPADDEDTDELEKEVLSDTAAEYQEQENVQPIKTVEVSNVIMEEKKEDSVSETEMDKDLAELDKESVNASNETDLITKKLRDSIKTKFTTNLDTMDLSKFTIINKPVNVNHVTIKTSPTARNWVLMRTGVPISMLPFDGTEIETLASIFDGNGRRNIGTSDVERGYQLIYDHIVSSKGSSLKNFLKTVSYHDLDHIFFAVYNTNYADSNYIPYNCTADPDKCKNVFVSDNISITDMCKFKDEEAKAKFNRIGRMDTTIDYNATHLYKSELIPISNTIAVALREPSIYGMIFEPSMISNGEFRRKYAFMINNLPYIDGFYQIDVANQKIQPIGYKEYTNDVEKTLKSKIIVYTKILKSNLTSDEFSRFEIIINNFQKDFGEELTYVLPETICPECEAKIEAVPTSASELVFTRHRLPAFAVTSND